MSDNFTQEERRVKARGCLMFRGDWLRNDGHAPPVSRLSSSDLPLYLNQPYRHYRGGIYIPTGVASRESDGMLLIIYAHQSNESWPWVRPLYEWFEKTPSGEPRFVLLSSQYPSDTK